MVLKTFSWNWRPERSMPPGHNSEGKILSEVSVRAQAFVITRRKTAQFIFLFVFTFCFLAASSLYQLIVHWLNARSAGQQGSLVCSIFRPDSLPVSK
jgi:hypothetical protein